MGRAAHVLVSGFSEHLLACETCASLGRRRTAAHLDDLVALVNTRR